MNRRECAYRRTALRGGMTLIELLVAVAIIAILVTMGFLALGSAREAARRASTLSTVTKIADIINEKYESYTTRKLPITSDEIDQLLMMPGFWTIYWSELPKLTVFQGRVPQLQAILADRGSLSVQVIWEFMNQPGAEDPNLNQDLSEMRALTRLTAMRDLIRLEMPERVSDLWAVDPATGAMLGNRNLPVWSLVGNQTTTPAMDYLWVVTSMTGDGMSPRDGLNPGELLYLIVSQAAPEMMGLFQPSEIGDVGMASTGEAAENGLSEFLDGWGKPIVFYRSMPGYYMSDIQTSAYTADEGVTWQRMIRGKPMTLAVDDGAGGERSVTDFAGVRQLIHEDDPDPLDVMGVDPTSWRTVPIVMSAGPDGEFGVFFQQLTASEKPLPLSLGPYNLYQTTPGTGDAVYLMGIPLERNDDPVNPVKIGEGLVVDNITNHQPAGDR